MPIFDEYKSNIIKFIGLAEEAKSPLTEKDWVEFAKSLENIGMKSKAIAVRMARHYGVSSPLTVNESMKIPSHIRGYGIAGAMDKKKDFGYLRGLYAREQLDYAGVIQAVEGWIAGDPCSLASSYYQHQSFCPDRWVKEIIETALWGDSVRAAVKIAVIEPRHLDWACHLIRTRPVGDPSNAIVDLYDAGMIRNFNYIIETMTHDKTGCPASAAKRLRDKKCLSSQEFRSFVKNAKSGNPAAVVQGSYLSDDIDFAIRIAEGDISVAAPRLAIWLVTQKNADPEWGIKVVQKSKFYNKIDYVSIEILNNYLDSSYRQTTKSRHNVMLIEKEKRIEIVQ